MGNRFIFEKNEKTGKYIWAITRDVINKDSKYSDHSLDATEEQKKAVKKDCKFHFKLYDDDILYYEGLQR